MKKNFFDQIDSDWGDVIADTYERANDPATIDLYYKYKTEISLYKDFTDLITLNSAKFVFKTLTSDDINVSLNNDGSLKVILSEDDFDYTYYLDDEIVDNKKGNERAVKLQLEFEFNIYEDHYVLSLYNELFFIAYRNNTTLYGNEFTMNNNLISYIKDACKRESINTNKFNIF